RLNIFCKDSTKDEFPGLYDLIVGFEVLPHIERKRETFENILRHLTDDGRVILADCVADTVTEINMPHLAMFTSTSEQYSEVLSEVGLKLIECVDISPEIANFLDDDDFEKNLAELMAVKPSVREFEETYRGWYSFGQGVKKGIFRYLLLTLGKAEGESPEPLRAISQGHFDRPMSYRERMALEPAPREEHAIDGMSDEEIEALWARMETEGDRS
ncbi:MAG: hypothetical protein AAF492_14820, partial [Verrucomicrobiota bacterium]